MQNNISNNSNVSFKANIRFVTSKDYSAMAKTLQPLIFSEMRQLDEIETVLLDSCTSNIKNCVAGVLKKMNNFKQYAFHWFSGCMTKDALLKVETKLKRTKKKTHLGGFAIGGEVMCLGECRESSAGQHVIGTLAKCFSKEELEKFSLFLGQKNYFKNLHFSRTCFIYSKKEDTYYVNSQLCLPEIGYKDVTTREDIRDNFEYINIANDDKVFIGLNSEDAIPREFLNKGDLDKFV